MRALALAVLFATVTSAVNAGETSNLPNQSRGMSYVTDDISCPALQFVRRTAADTTWECAPGAVGGDALTTNPLSQFASTTSAQLSGVLSNETGSGAAVFGTSPTITSPVLVTPALGTPASGVATNLTGTAANLTVGTASAVALGGITGLGAGAATSLAIANDTAGSLAKMVAKGTSALGTSSIASEACATVVTTTATGTASTDAIQWTPNADITAVTGYAPVVTGALAIYPYPTTNNVNWKVCNPTSNSITPGAVTLNWRVVR